MTAFRPAWEVPTAVAHFEELIQRCQADGPQSVTLDGVETAVVVSAEEWRQIRGSALTPAQHSSAYAPDHRTGSADKTADSVPESQPEIPFPDARFIAMTWTIPPNYGGMTSVLLRRATMIAQLAGLPVPILTFDSSLDVEAKTTELLASGALGPGVTLRNCWHEIARMSDEQLAALVDTSGTVQPADADAQLTLQTDDESRRTFVDDTGVARRIDHLRADGSIYLSDQRALVSGGGLTLHASGGKPIFKWHRARDFYFAWVDHVLGSDRAIIVNDSKYVGSFLRYYRRPHAHTVQVFHNPHLSTSATSQYGPFTKSRVEILHGHEDFDGLAFLTERQKDDFLAAFSRKGHTFVVPNSRQIPEILPDSQAPRTPGAGIMLARLTDQKQVDHTLCAMAVLDGQHPDADVSIDIYGSGPLEDDIAQLIIDQNVSHRVKLRGFQPDAATQLEQASFIVLSSKYEGLPLVLVEAMAAGCVPIAYDVRYGTRDVVTHGVDGLIVPDGDIAGLADTIHQFTHLPEPERAAMRAAAQRKARQFDDHTVTQMWADVCTTLLGSRPGGQPVGTSALATLAEFNEAEGGTCLSIRGTLQGDWPLDPDSIRIVAVTRQRRYGFDHPVQIRAKHAELTFETHLPVDRFGAERGTYDFWLTASGRSRRRRLALKQGAIGERAMASLNGDARLYPTAHGNLSLEIRPTDS